MDKNDCITLTHTQYIELASFYLSLNEHGIVDKEGYDMLIKELGEEVYG